MAIEAEAAAPVRSFVERVLGVHANDPAPRIGARGGDLVARRLKRLPKRSWCVFHDLSLDADDCHADHVVIGPGGVFVLKVTYLTGNVWVAERVMRVNGKPVDYLRKARSEAQAVAGHLAESGVQFEAVPVVVVIADRLTVETQPADVSVVEHQRIAKWLTNRPRRLVPEDVARLAELV